MENIIKAEILISRRCTLGCSYCNMATGEKNTLSVKNWIRGIDQLKELDCKFIAFYGAEPLLEMDVLAPLVRHAENIGIDTTVITSGVLTNTKPRLLKLIKFGLKSLTVSFDINPADKDSARKSEAALKTLEYFQKKCPNLRDRAVVVTLTEKNYRGILPAIIFFSQMGIYTFIDLYHYDRGYIGSKTKGYDTDLIFKDPDEVLLYLKKVISMKEEEGYLVHLSKNVLDIYTQNKFKPEWHCSKCSTFPSWLTIDCDGTVYPCDDFTPKRGIEFSITEIADNIERWKTYWTQYTAEKCPGCNWCTHIQAHSIKQNTMDLSEYIHGK